MITFVSRQEFLRRRSAAKRSAALSAARRRFAADGLDGASVERIAQEAQVSTATLYRLFPSKLALFEAVLRDGLTRFEETLGASAASPSRERLIRLAAAYATLLDDPLNAGMIRAVFAAAPSSPEVTQIFYERVKRSVLGAFTQAALAAAADGAIVAGKDPLAASRNLMGMIEHATLWRRLISNAPGDEPAEAIASAALEAFWSAYGRHDLRGA